MRLTNIYTKKGDKGETTLSDGTVVKKYDLRVDSYGNVDELNSIIGLILQEDLEPFIEETLRAIQHDLFNIGGELATPGNVTYPQMVYINLKNTENLERVIDFYLQKLEPLQDFVLPGTNSQNSLFHLARTVTRRTERIITLTKEKYPIREEILIYLNRLSDLFFVFSRITAQNKEILWDRNQGTLHLSFLNPSS